MEKLILDAWAKTSTADIQYSVEFCLASSTEISTYVDKEKFDKLCLNGCPNFKKKWSCPPYAPIFMNFIANWNKLFTIYIHTNMSQFFYIKNDYLKIKAANSILKSRADKFLRQMAVKYGSYISTGSCRLCKPCKCKIGQACAHPELMTYSFEAMGVDVGELVAGQFQKPLLWYKPHYLPEYTSVVCGLLTNDEITVEGLQEEYLQHIKY